MGKRRWKAMAELLYRFFVGGLVVSAFATLGDVLTQEFCGTIWSGSKYCNSDINVDGVYSGSSLCGLGGEHHDRRCFSIFYLRVCRFQRYEAIPHIFNLSEALVASTLVYRRVSILGALVQVLEFMKIKTNFSAVRETKCYEYAIRFIFGGLITVAAGIIAKQFGPSIGGLFLAFPAIFPASLSLVDKHTKERKEQAGLVIEDH